MENNCFEIAKPKVVGPSKVTISPTGWKPPASIESQIMKIINTPPIVKETKSRKRNIEDAFSHVTYGREDKVVREWGA